MKKRIAVVGASECGKTTLAIHLSRAFWERFKIASLVLDPRKNKNRWGPQAWVTTDKRSPGPFMGEWNEAKGEFEGGIWGRKGDLVIMDEGSTTIARDAELIPFFTQIRHWDHHLLAVCHNAKNLLPDMRQNLNELYLFPQTRRSVDLLQEDLPMMQGIGRSMTESGKCELGPYEFIRCRNNQPAEKIKLKL